MKAELADGGLPPRGEPMEEFAWEAWSPAEVAERLAGLDVPWAFAAGWAIDLCRGGATREHEDTEIAIPRGAFDPVRERLAPYEFDVVGSARRWPVSDARALAGTHQTWLRRPSSSAYVLDVFREPHEGDTWICRRDPELRRPYSEVIRKDPAGLPYLAPEIVLLFKARLMRAKDEHDFTGVLPLLDEGARGWLAGALRRTHPGHAWIERLTA